MRKVQMVSAILVMLLLLSGLVFAGGEQEGAAEAADSDEPTVALIVKNLVNPYFVNLKLGADAAAAHYGISLTTFAPERVGDIEAQIRLMEDAVQRGYDLIMVSPIDVQGIISGMERVNEAGVPIITVDSRAGGGEWLTHVGISNYELAKTIAEYIVDDLGGEATIVQMEGKPGSSSNIDRARGFNDVFDANPGIVTLDSVPANYQKADGMRVAEDMLVRHQDIDAFVTYNDSMALGVVEALKAAGELDDVYVSGINGSEDALASIAAGEMDVTIDSNPFDIGFKGAEAAYEYLVNGVVPPEEIVAGEDSMIVTQANVQEFADRIPSLLEQYNVER